MDLINDVVSFLNGILWSKVLIFMLLIVGVYLTLRLGFFQFQLRRVKDMLGILLHKSDATGERKVSAFQAFCISLASRIGTGNLAGVAIAIALGGPGAIFWMWLIAILGTATAFVENTLAQIYKVRDVGGFRGGPAYYMVTALKQKWMGIFYVIITILSLAMALSSLQSNTIADAFHTAFNANKLLMGFIIAIPIGFISFGGLKRIARAATLIVPIMGVLYTAVVLTIILLNLPAIPGIIALIFKGAFGVEQAVGGGIGVAMMQGIKRGLFSNEAGMGTAPIGGATSNVSHPAKQGFIGSIGVLVDTLIVCSATAFVILLSGIYSDTPLNGIQLTQEDGIQLTQGAFESYIGSFGAPFVALCILLFSFSSIMAYCWYGEASIKLVTSRQSWISAYRILVLLMIVWGSVQSLDTVWGFADLFTALMTIMNLVTISLLGKIAFMAFRDYIKQRKEGGNPVFNPSDINVQEGLDYWKE